jgi:hypothetical protein
MPENPTAENHPDNPPQRQSDWKNLRRIPPRVWWAIAGFAVVWVAIIGWRVMDVAGVFEPRLLGDGEHVQSYQFDLSAAKVPVDRIVPTVATDAIPALIDPEHMPGVQVQVYNQEERGKFLVSDDRVIGLVINGQARAYPLRLLNWHEVANDTLGGVPVAVTYHPLCDSAVVFDRRVNEQVLTFGVSGLLYNSNHLLYDHAERLDQRSLWSQLAFEAVAGPAAEADRSLRVIGSVVCTWEDWLRRYPRTTVMRGRADFKKRYARNPYGLYFQQRKPSFEVQPYPPADHASGFEPFDRVIAFQMPPLRWVLIDAAMVDATIDAQVGQWRLSANASRVEPITPADLTELLNANLHEPPDTARSVHCLWFAWYAFQGDAWPVVEHRE